MGNHGPMTCVQTLFDSFIEGDPGRDDEPGRDVGEHRRTGGDCLRD